MRKCPCNPVLTITAREMSQDFMALKKANHGVYKPAPISMALAGKAKPLKDPVSLCARLKKTLTQPTVMACHPV